MVSSGVKGAAKWVISAETPICTNGMRTWDGNVISAFQAGFRILVLPCSSCIYNMWDGGIAIHCP